MQLDIAVNIIKESFRHFMYEENVKIGTTEALLYFPSIGIAIFESEDEKVYSTKVENINEHLLRREFNAKPVYLNLDEEDFCIGYVINDIILQAELLPSEHVEERGSHFFE